MASGRLIPYDAGRMGTTMELLGLRIGYLSVDALVKRINRNRASGNSEFLATLDVLGLDRALQDHQYASALQDAGLILLDGAGLILAARLLDVVPPPRFPGADVFDRLVETAPEQNWRIFLYGARPGVAETLAGILRRRHPGVTICGVLDGYGDPDCAVEIIQRCQPDLLFVALGAPAQEIFLACNHSRLNTPLAIGVGGTFDVRTGLLRRAPRFMQRAGLEWLFRLLQEPTRIFRIRRIPLFFLQLLVHRWNGTMPRVH